MNRILASIFPAYPEYSRIQAPQIAIVPDGEFHPSVPLNASPELQWKSDTFWREKLHPWIRQHTNAFFKAVPSAKIVMFELPDHHVFLAQEDETLKVICDTLA